MVNANAKTVMEVWQEIRKDRERGAGRLVAEYGNRLYAAAVLLCANNHDAEELVFRTFDQAVKKIRQFDPSRNFFTWLYAIMLNFHRMNHRRRRIEVVPMGAAEDLPEQTTAPTAETQDACAISPTRPLRRLPPRWTSRLEPSSRGYIMPVRHWLGFCPDTERKNHDRRRC